MVPTIRGERRSGERRAMNIPISIPEVGTGSTVDISMSGVSFMIDTRLQPGSVIAFALSVEAPGGRVELQCQGTVVRVEQRGPSLITAATIENLAVRNSIEH
jgi:hypothetical protein